MLKAGCTLVLGLLDHGSHSLLALNALPNKCSWILLGHPFLAIGKYGKPCAVRTDNEAVFTSRLFRGVLALAGIDHQRSEPGCPWQNGRIERLFGTLKGCLDQLQTGSGAALDHLLPELRFFYNQVRPRQNLQGRTPAQAWAGVNPSTARIKQEYWFEAWTISCKVITCAGKAAHQIRRKVRTHCPQHCSAKRRARCEGGLERRVNDA